MRRTVLVAIVVLAASSACVMAGVGVGFKAGTLGLGAEVTVGVFDTANLRLGVNGASIDLSSLVKNDDQDSSAEDIKLSLDLQTFAALLDWHCFDDGFRLTAGAMINKNEVGLSADANETVEIGDKIFPISALDGFVGFGRVAPYLGMGYGNAADKSRRVTFAFDLGVIFQGSPDVELTATASNPQLQGQLNAELEKESQDIEDDLASLTIYPVISFGFAVRF